MSNTRPERAREKSRRQRPLSVAVLIGAAEHVACVVGPVDHLELAAAALGAAVVLGQDVIRVGIALAHAPILSDSGTGHSGALQAAQIMFGGT